MPGSPPLRIERHVTDAIPPSPLAGSRAAAAGRRLLLVLLALLFTSAPAPVLAALNDTGIATCSNATQNGLACPVAGFPRQDAEFGRDVTHNDDSDGHAGFSFTKLDAAGHDLPASATDHVCVRDNVTGLIWEVKTDDGALRDQDWTYSWYDSREPGGDPGTPDGGDCYGTGRCDTEKYVADVNAAGLCGASDWRMPGVKDLFGIVDHSVPHPGSTIDADYFPHSPSSYVWSGSPDASSSNGAWNVYFGVDDAGDADEDRGAGEAADGGRESHHQVRLVHGDQSLDFFVDHGNGTVTQTNAGLMWAKCSVGQSGDACHIGSATEMSWGEALTAAKASRLGSYNDWRLPNIKELQGLVDYGKSLPAINGNYFPNTPPDSDVWSGSPYANDSGHARYVYFGRGHTDHDNDSSPVRLVRDGSFDLTVAKDGDGAGDVTSSPAGIACGALCKKRYPYGTQVTLAASPATGSTFAGWSGACRGIGTCVVTMDAAQTVTATFRRPVVKLKIGDVSKPEGKYAVTKYVDPVTHKVHTITSVLRFPVTLTPASDRIITVRYTTASGTATEGVDYAKTTGTLTFAPGVTARSIVVFAIGDPARESDELFKVTLSAPAGASLQDGEGWGTIVNDD